MVDFNSEATVGTPAVDIVRVMVLERLNNLYDGVEDYFKKIEQGYDKDLSVVKARLYSLWLIIEAQVTRKEGKNKAKEYEQKIKSNDFDELKEMITYFNKYLDELKLTRLDTKKVYDGSRVEVENQNRALG